MHMQGGGGGLACTGEKGDKARRFLEGSVCPYWITDLEPEISRSNTLLDFEELCLHVAETFR